MTAHCTRLYTFLMGLCLWMGSIRRLLFWLKVGALQYAILKTVLSIVAVVLWTNGNFDLSDVSFLEMPPWNASENIMNIRWHLKYFFASPSVRDHRHSHLDQPIHRRPHHHLPLAGCNHLHEHQQISTRPQYGTQVRHVSSESTQPLPYLWNIYIFFYPFWVWGKSICLLWHLATWAALCCIFFKKLLEQKNVVELVRAKSITSLSLYKNYTKSF